MSPVARTLTGLLLLFVGTLAVGCDSTDFEGCVDADDPAASPGDRRLACPSSVFKTEDLRAREVVGVVHRGEDVIPGAMVRIDPTPGFAASRSAAPASTFTDLVGFFGGLRTVSLRYDLSVKLGEDLLFYRALATRWMDPSLEAPRSFARAYTGRVDVRFDREISAGRSVAFFASGDGVLSVSADGASGLSVLHQKYTNPATIHAVEYETSGGLEKATAYGKVDVVLDAAVPQLAAFSLAPIDRFAEPTFSVTGPSGFVPSTIDIRIGFTRTSDAVLASIPVGTSKKLPLIPNAGYTYQLRATLDGAVSDSGETGFDVLLPVTEIALPEPPTVASPLEGEERKIGESLLVDGEGVFEHVLVPEAGGREIRIITAQRDTTIPDASLLGAAPATGPHTWTVRSFPKARFADELSGVDTRRYRPMSVSRPRTIVLR